MKFAKFFGFLGALSALGYATFYITYETVSATVMEEAEENKKNEVVIKPIIVQEDEEDEEEKKPRREIRKEESLNVKTDNFIFIGDDRLNSMAAVSNSVGFKSVEFVTRENPDYFWMVNEGADTLDYILESKPGNYNIVFNLGINDLNNVKMYIDFFNHLAYKHPNQNIFVLTIGPLDEIKAMENNISNINNDDIYSFNIDMKKGFNENVHIVHVFQELIVNGYDTTDGYYLTEDTSISLLKFIWNHVKELQNN